MLSRLPIRCSRHLFRRVAKYMRQRLDSSSKNYESMRRHDQADAERKDQIANASAPVVWVRIGILLRSVLLTPPRRLRVPILHRAFAPTRGRRWLRSSAANAVAPRHPKRYARGAPLPRSAAVTRP